MAFDVDAISRELVRAVRGRRSQLGLSRALRYRTNALYTWEAGTAWPTTTRFFQLARRVGVDVPRALAQFMRTRRRLDDRVYTVAGVTELLNELRGGTPLHAIAREGKHSRFSLSRWLNGKAEPKLPALLGYVDRTSMRLPDFIAAFTDPERLPSVCEDWRRIQAARDVGYEYPITHAVLRALELQSYRKARRHDAGLIAERLGIERDVVDTAIERLARCGQIRMRSRRWEPSEVELVDFSVRSPSLANFPYRRVA